MAKVHPYGLKTRILKRRFNFHNIPQLDIIESKNKEDWFNALWFCFSNLEMYLKRLVLLKKINYAKTIPVTQHKRIMSKPFGATIDLAKNEGFIGSWDKKRLQKIKEVRDDMAHSFFLVHNEYINRSEAEKTIKNSLGIIHRLHKKVMKEQKKIK